MASIATVSPWVCSICDNSNCCNCVDNCIRCGVKKEWMLKTSSASSPSVPVVIEKEIVSSPPPSEVSSPEVSPPVDNAVVVLEVSPQVSPPVQMSAKDDDDKYLELLKCRDCSKQFQTMKTYYNHRIKKICRPKITEGDVSKALPSKDKKFACDLCDGKYTYESGLKKHKLDFHSSTGAPKGKFFVIIKNPTDNTRVQFDVKNSQLSQRLRDQANAIWKVSSLVYKGRPLSGMETIHDLKMVEGDEILVNVVEYGNTDDGSGEPAQKKRKTSPNNGSNENIAI